MRKLLAFLAALAFSGSVHAQTINPPPGGGGATCANPTATVGTSATNGSASTCIRSDGAPAIDQTMAPTMSGAWIYSANGAASTPPVKLGGTWFSGGSATTTKPQFLVECNTGTTTTNNWNTAGSGLGINACTGFTTGYLIDAQVNGAKVMNLNGNGVMRLLGIHAIGEQYVYTDGNSAIADVSANRNIDIGGASKYFNMRTGGTIGWANGDPAATASDTAFSRDAPGVIDVGTGANASKAGSLNGTNLTFTGVITFAGVTTGTNADFACFAAGGVMTLQNSACTISSARFKTGIIDEPAFAALNEVMKLTPVAFNMKPQAQPNRDPNFLHRQVGLTAENVAAVDPRLAIYEDDGKTPKSYRQEAVIAELVGAVKAQQQEIEALRAELHRHRR